MARIRRKKEERRRLIGMEFEYGFVWNYEYLYGNYGCMEV